MASKGVYITHEEVDALLDRKGRMTPSRRRWPPIALTRSLLQNHRQRQTGNFPVAALGSAALFVVPFEVQTLIVCLAPELRRKYDTLYAYLQDDITRKRPSVDLVLDVLCPSEAERWRARTTVFSDQAPLFRHGILHRVEDPAVRPVPAAWRNSYSSTSGCSTTFWRMMGLTGVSPDTPPCCILPRRWSKSWLIRRSKPAW